MEERPEITALLKELEGGDASAVEVLLPRLYTELRGLAHAQLRRERAGHTLATTALVHEAYLKLNTVHLVVYELSSLT